MSIITAIMLIPLFILVVWYVLYSGGFRIGESNRYVQMLTGINKKYEAGGNVGWKKTVKIGAEALAFRLVVYFVAYLLLLMIYESDETFLEWYTKWDATNYVGITSGGYSEIKIDGVAGMGDGVMQTLVFFPMYPVLARIVNVFSGNVYYAMLITSTICFVAGIIYTYKAVSYRYGESIAHKVVVLISAGPFAFYQGAMLPESTFLLVTSVCMYYTFTRKWYMAGIAGILCSLTRIQGILVIAFMGMEWLEDRQVFMLIKNKDRKAFMKSLGVLPAIIMPFVGIVIYLIINYVYTGDMFYFMKLQNNVWGHSYTNIFKAMDIMWNNFITQDYVLRFSLWGPQIIIFFGTLLLIYITIMRHNAGMSVLLLIYLIISYSTDYVVSGSRYMSVAIPLFIMIGEVCDRRQWLYRFAVYSGLLLQVVYMGCHLRGVNVVV